MTIFQLMVYSCVSVVNLGGDLMSKTCRWDERPLYSTTDKCEEAGAKELMTKIFDDVFERRVEKHRCVPVEVN